jgi:hypothetical protein
MDHFGALIAHDSDRAMVAAAVLRIAVVRMTATHS